MNLLIEIKDSKKIKNSVVMIVINKHIPPINLLDYYESFYYLW